MTELKNILIVRTDRIGDVVLTLPLANIIKKHLPNCKISFLVREYTAPLLRNNPSIDEIIILDESNQQIQVKNNIRNLRAKNFDTAFVVNASFKLALILFRANITNRISTGYRWYSFLFNKKIFVHRKTGNKHELEYNVDMLKQIGINEFIDFNNVCFNIQIDKYSTQKVDEFLSANTISDNKIRIIIHPGSGGSAFDLPKNKLKYLTEQLAQELDADIIITGNEKEKHLCDYVSGKANVFNCAGKFNLKEMISLINSADILIANSTGPIHIAAALNKYVFGFYPTIHSMSKKRWGPYTSKCEIFEPDNCDNFDSKTFLINDCMNNINIEKVLTSIKIVITKFSKN